MAKTETGPPKCRIEFTADYTVRGAPEEPELSFSSGERIVCRPSTAKHFWTRGVAKVLDGNMFDADGTEDQIKGGEVQMIYSRKAPPSSEPAGTGSPASVPPPG